MKNYKTRNAAPAYPLYAMDVMEVPGCRASAVFTTPPNSVFREQGEVLPMTVTDSVTIMPWGADNRMPYSVMNHIDSDETMSTCMEFNAEVLYGAGLQYDTSGATSATASEVEDFFDRNDMASYFMGVARDFKYFGFAVSVIILSADRRRIAAIRRKEACYCRFAPADASGRIPCLHYAQWRNASPPAVS